LNIFKVLASRKKFPEEMTSVLFGWLMHPEMEHGLGRLFLECFVKETTERNDSDVARQLNTTPDDEVKCVLEESVPNALIDIVYLFGGYVFAIENKIYDGSIEEKQLQREYYGLRRKYSDKRIILVYLVPDISPMASIEYDALVNIVEQTHICALATWSDTVCDIVDNIFRDETTRTITPIPEETKLILNSLKAFVKDGFYGYDFIYKGGRNNTRSAFPRSTYAELRLKTQGFVGVALGAAGLMKMSKEEIISRGFQYDHSLECNRQYWLPLKEFIALAEQRISGERLPTGFRQRLDSASIYELVCQPNNSQIYIGIQGGERGLLAMEQHEINVKSWQVTTGEQPNSQWIPGERYKQIYENKFPERKLNG